MALAYALAGPVGVNGIWAAIPIGWFLADAVGYGYYFLRRRALLRGRHGDQLGQDHRELPVCRWRYGHRDGYAERGDTPELQRSYRIQDPDNE